MLVVFCGVQDRITAAGARRYVAQHAAAHDGNAPAVTLDAVMRPAIRRSVEQGLLWSGAVGAAGLAATMFLGRRSGRE